MTRVDQALARSGKGAFTTRGLSTQRPMLVRVTRGGSREDVVARNRAERSE